MIKNKKGYEGSFMNIFVGLVLVALFGMLILLAVNDTGNYYGKDTSSVTGGSLSMQKFNDSISDINENAQGLKLAFDSQSVWSALAGVVVEGIFGLAKNIATLMLFPFQLIQDIMIDVLNIPVFVASTILGLFIFSILIAIWRLIKIGE